MPSLNRKREREGGQDGARPSKRTSTVTSASASASASASNPASVAAAPENSDPQILICPYDGHRRYDEWKGMMNGFLQVISGGGAMYPTNYQINFRHPEPWICPMANCRKCFQQSAQLGAHFSRAHRKLLLYDEACRGRFWAIGERKNPDKDGRFRSIVVKRGYYGPDDVRQPPEDWESYVNPTAVKDIKPPNLPQPAVAPAALSSTTHAIASASRHSAAPAVATPRPLPAPAASAAAPPAVRHTAPGAGLVGRPTGNSIHEVIDISSDEEDVKPSLAELQRESNSATPGPQSLEAQREAQSSGGNEADTQEDPFQDSPFLSGDPVEPVHDRNGSTRKPVNRQVLETKSRISGRPSQSESLDIWTYITQFARTAAPRPDDAAITELLKLRRRRELPFIWRRRLGTFNTLSLHQLTAVILYLCGDASLTSPCIPMRCNLKRGTVNCADPCHKDGQCPSCRLAFPECVYLPRHILSSEAILKRVDIYFCCNAYYRCVGMQQPDGAVRLTYVDEIAAIKTIAVGNTTREITTLTSKPSKPTTAPPTGQLAHSRLQTSASRSSQSITPSVSSRPVFFTNLAIHNKPRTTHQQPPNTMNDDESDPFDFDPFDFEPGHMSNPQNGNIQLQTNAQLASSNSSAAQKKPLPQSSSVWDYVMSFSKTKIPIPDDEAITELLALRRLRELPKSWKYRLGAFDELDLKSYTAVILYLTGDEAGTSPCNVMGCNRNESVVKAAAELASRQDYWYRNRVNVKFAFPQCVFLPQYLLSSKALSKRLGIKTCCNAYYRIDKPGDKASKEQVMAALGRTGTDGTANNRASSNSASKMTANSGSNHAKPNNSIPKRSHFMSSAATSFTGQTIHHKPQTTPQQRNNKASLQKSSGTFCIPEGTPGQMFSLKGTDTKLIQSSRNQILKCKVLAGDGVKAQIIGGKEFKAYKGWDDEWEIPPDSQCLVKNIHPKKSFGEDQTCIDVNPKKGVVKAGQA